jgi:hypothetical protein
MSSPVWAAAELEKMQALYIQKIINYVDWPENAGEEFVIAVDGQDELFNQLEQIFRTPILGKTVKIIRYDWKDTTPPARILCLFTSRSKIPFQAGLLVITQSTEGIPEGAIINFIARNRMDRSAHCQSNTPN